MIQRVDVLVRSLYNYYTKYSGPTDILIGLYYRLILDFADILVSVYGAPICGGIKTVFKAAKNAWNSDLKQCNYEACGSLFLKKVSCLLFSALRFGKKFVKM